METTTIITSTNHADCEQCAWHLENAVLMQSVTGCVAFTSQDESGKHVAWAQIAKAGA